MLLARLGYRVLLVDRATFPSDTISTHWIWQLGTACLKRWGLLDRVLATNCPPFRTMGLDLGAFQLTGDPPAADGVAEIEHTAEAIFVLIGLVVWQWFSSSLHAATNSLP